MIWWSKLATLFRTQDISSNHETMVFMLNHHIALNYREHSCIMHLSFASPWVNLWDTPGELFFRDKQKPFKAPG